MSRRGWFGLPEAPDLLAGLRRPAREGLVLSGGGSRAGFQIGALRYLYDRAGIAPTVFVGTSAGSILVSMLSQHGSAADQAGAVDELDRLWRGMTKQSDMFVERRWFAQLKQRLQEFPAPLTLPLSPTLADEPTIDLPDDPQARTLALATREVEAAGRELRAGQVLQFLGWLPRLGRIGGDLPAIVRAAENTRSMYRPGPILEQLLSRDRFHADEIATSGNTVRIAMVALDSGQLRYLTQDGQIVSRDDEPVPGTTRHNVTMGNLASCSIPGVFPPVRLDDEWYVDGGVRENVPVEMAIAHLGVRNPWVVTSAAPGVPASDGFDRKNLLSIMFRASAIQSDETEHDEIAYARSVGARVVEPEIEVHDSLTIDPALTAINIDYGFVRAAEEHLGLSAHVVGVHRHLIEARVDVVRHERAWADEPAEDTLRALALAKLEVQDLVAKADREALPPGAEAWWCRFEDPQLAGHGVPWLPPGATPTDSQPSPGSAHSTSGDVP